MDVSLRLVLLLLAVGAVLGDSKFYCRESQRYSKLNTCIVEGVDMDEVNYQELSFPPEVDVEFREARFSYLGLEVFNLIRNTKWLTLRGGFTRHIVFWSDCLEVLRVINTDLELFDIPGEPNYTLKQLAIRSALFSQWSITMMYLKSLEVIDVAYCNFSYFDLDQLKGFQNLTTLDLSYNKLQALNSGPFLKLKNLKELYLQGNQLQFVWRFPDVVPKLNFITLSDNPWLCGWVTMARNAIWLKRFTLMDSDYNCDSEGGWENSGGLCCQRASKDYSVINGVITVEQKIPKGILDILVVQDGNETKAIGAELSGSGVYLDDPVV